eukprot:g65500.t1
MLWCVFHKNPHGIRSVCTKGRKIAWARGQLLADLLLELGADPVEYASHKTSAEQWLFVRRCWGRAAPHAPKCLRKLFEETTRAVHRKTVAAQARRVADALRLSQAMVGDQLSLRLVPRGAQPVQKIPLFLDRAAIDRGRVRLWLRLYRCAGAEHALNWVRDDDSRLIEATVADGRDTAALAKVAGVSPASYVRVALVRKGGSLCGLRAQWPGYCEADWSGLDSGRERWYTHELAPWFFSLQDHKGVTQDQLLLIQRALLRVDLVRVVVRDALVLRNIFEARRAGHATEAVTAPVALPEGCGAGRGACVSGGAWPGSAAELALLAQAQDDLRAGRLHSSEADRFRVGDHAVAVAEARSHTLLRYFVPAWSGGAFASVGVAGRCEYDAPWGEKVDLTGHEPLPSRCETLSMTWPWQFAVYWNWRNWVAIDAFSHGATRWSAGGGNCSSLSFPLWRNEPVLVDGRWQGCFEPRCPQPVPYNYDWYARSTVSWSVPDTAVAPRDATVAPCGWDRGICGSNGRCQCNSGFRVKPNTDPTTLVYDAAGEPRVARVLQQDACDIDGRGVCKSLLVPTKEIVCGQSTLPALVRVIGDQKFPWACACQTGAFETDSGLCKAKVVALVEEYGTPPQ